jgi:transketolase
MKRAVGHSIGMNVTGNTSSKADLSPGRLRSHVLRMAFSGKTVHIPCAFSIIEVVSVLYSGVLRFDRRNPRAADRDYFFLSKGHGVMALYAAFRELGWIRQEDLDRYFSSGSLLHGLSEAHIPGLEVSSGTLGHGLPIAVGTAFALQMKGETNRHVYCLVGDGEINEGPCWEAMLFANQHKLSNLTVIVDVNGHQAMGRTEEILSLEPLADKFKAFGFETFDIDGHSVSKLGTAFKEPAQGRPKAIVARTVKGKGVSFMEDDNRWHYTRLNEEQYKLALQEVSPK